MRTREEKNRIIGELAEKLNNCSNFYITDTAEINAENTSKLRRICFEKNIELEVVKNTLLEKAMEKTGKDFENLATVLSGYTSIMYCDIANEPARLIKEFRKSNSKSKPVFKGAYVQECVYVGENQLEALCNVKSKNELIGEVIGLLQSPIQNVVSALNSGGQKIAGIVKTLSERE